MTDLNDIRVLKLLLNYKNVESSSINVPQLPLMDLDIVETISDTLTDIVYYSFTNNSVARNTIIELIGKWTRINSHFMIDDSNIDIFINNCFVNTKAELKIDNIEQFSVDPVKLGSIDHWNNILDTINKKYKIDLENKIKTGLLQMWDVAQFKASNFEFNAPNLMIQNPEVEKTIDLVQNLKLSQSFDEKQIINMDIDQNCSDNSNISIELGYALLQLEGNLKIDELFLKIIDNISKIKTDATIKFAEYLWENKGSKRLGLKIYIKLFERFEHLYEKVIINTCTHILEDLRPSKDVSEYETALTQPDLQDILNICNNELMKNILAILNKLLKLSKMDKRLLIFYKLFVQKYINKIN